MQEIWRDVIGYEGLYKVSNLGNIKSVDRMVTRYRYYLHVVRVPGQKLCPVVHQSGYKRTPLCKNGITKHLYVHSLVAAAFLGKKPEGFDIDHIDHDRTNNNINNLRYITIKENRGIPGNKHASGSLLKPVENLL